ncbi:hypothetical protein BpHYR1_001371, partial [Brachionus plicatilis]
IKMNLNNSCKLRINNNKLQIPFFVKYLAILVQTTSKAKPIISIIKARSVCLFKKSSIGKMQSIPLI